MKILKEKSVIGPFFHHSEKTHYLILCTDNRTQYVLLPTQELEVSSVSLHLQLTGAALFVDHFVKNC